MSKYPQIQWNYPQFIRNACPKFNEKKNTYFKKWQPISWNTPKFAEKTTKLLNSNIFVNKQETTEIANKIKKALDNNSSKKYFFKEDFNISRNENNFIHYQDDLGEILLPEPSILGEHQLGNISTSIAATRKIFQIKDEYIKLGVKNIKLKGRLEELKEGKLKKVIGKNKIFCDGGHNLGASRSLASWIKQQNQEVHVVVGMMKDKAHKEFINNLANFAKSITLIDIPNQEGSISKEEFKKKLGDLEDKILLSNDIKDVLTELSKRKDSICLITGSLYLVGEIYNLN